MPQDTSSLYRDVLRQAWKISWHQRLMWILGLFSAFIATGGAMELLSRNLKWTLEPHPWVWSWFLTSGHWSLVSIIWLIVLILLLIGLAGVFVMVVIRSFITLIKSADAYKEKTKIDLAKLWHKSQGKFWSVFGAVALFKVLEYLFVFLSLVPLWGFILGYWDETKLWVIYPIVFLIGIIGSLVCAFMVVFTSCYIVLEDDTLNESVVRSLVLFGRHWLVSLEMAIIIFVINFLFSLLIILGLVVIAIPVVAIVFSAFVFNLPIFASIAVFLGLVLGTMLIFWMAGFLGTFHTVAWTLLFKRMNKDNALSKLIRITNKIFKRS